MPTLSLIESQAAVELAKLLYDFLPGTFASVTWPDVATRFALGNYWQKGSKLPAITNLMRATLELHRERFCDFILAVVQEGIAYRTKKGNPLKREDIEELNRILLKLNYRIPELNDPTFLKGLETKAGQRPTSEAAFAMEEREIQKLHQQFLLLCKETDFQKRGYALETFLNDFFRLHGLDPRSSFRVIGEQIDGSFEWESSTFLVEARWRKEPANAVDLLVLRGKAEKSDWTRGLFISINGFTEAASRTLPVGRRANLIAMSGQDLVLILERHWTLHEALRAKLRYTGETAEPFKPLSELKK
jgi:hypothetical protein